MARRLVTEHGPAARTIAYARARACTDRKEEYAAATWLEIVRLVALLLQTTE